MTPNVIAFPTKAGSRGIVPSRLRDARIACGLNQTELAEFVAVSRQAISAFEAGDKNPDPTTMARIADAVRQPLAYFTAEDAEAFGATSTRFFRAFGADTKRRNLMSEVLGKWFVQTARYLYSFVGFPAVNLPSVSPRNGDRYEDDEIEEAAEACRKQWGLGLGPISNVVGLLENNGVTVCRYEMTGHKVEAFSFWNGPRPFVFLASEKQSAVRARFDAAHELGHLILHRFVAPEDIEDPKVLKVIEAEAHRFAGALLLPRRAFPNEVYTPRLDAFVDLKSRWKVAIQAMVYRCKDLGIFDEAQITSLYKQISYRKWRTREPLDDTLSFEEPSLLRKVVEVIVSAGRKSRDAIASELRLSGAMIAAFCGLPPSYFEPAKRPDFVPALR
jgi:Zn-dependent peptidase ImmA (M78 family)/DNA-binding XRE family transcriptional regulator